MSIGPPVHFCPECDLYPCSCDDGERIAELETELATANEVIRQIAERFGVTDVRHILADLAEVAAGNAEARRDAVTELNDLATWVRSGNYSLDDARDEIARAIEYRIRTLSSRPVAAKVDPLGGIRSLAHNWDSYGAPSIDSRAIKIAEVMLSKTQVVPTSHGGVQLEWHRDGFDIEIEVGPDGSISVYQEPEIAVVVERPELFTEGK